MLVLAYVTLVAFIFYWQAKKVTTRKSTKGNAIGFFALYSVTPVICYGVMFLLLIGIEELFDAAIIGESYARSLPLVMAGGIAVVLLATAAFSVVVLFLKQRDENTMQ